MGMSAWCLRLLIVNVKINKSKLIVLLILNYLLFKIPVLYMSLSSASSFFLTAAGPFTLMSVTSCWNCSVCTGVSSSLRFAAMSALMTAASVILLGSAAFFTIEVFASTFVRDLAFTIDLSSSGYSSGGVVFLVILVFFTFFAGGGGGEPAEEDETTTSSGLGFGLGLALAFGGSGPAADLPFALAAGGAPA
jgi:hypothetical protein